MLWILFDGGHPFRTALAFTRTPPEVQRMTVKAGELWREASGYDREVLVRVVRGGYTPRSGRKFGENDREGALSARLKLAQKRGERQRLTG